MKKISIYDGVIKEENKIDSIESLGNDVIILLERGDSLNKVIKKKQNIQGIKGACSIKYINQELQNLRIKAEKKSSNKAEKKSSNNVLCVVCCDAYAVNDSMYCSDCNI